MNDQKNLILAMVLSAAVLIGWQYFYGMPQMQKQRDAQQSTQQNQQTQQMPAPQPSGGTPGPQGGPPQVSGQSAAVGPNEERSREDALRLSGERIAVETPRMTGSIALKGGRIDDVSLATYHETVDPKSPAIVLLSPSGSPHPFYAEFGWVAPAGSNLKVPSAETVWRREGSGPLTLGRPTALTWDNGEGLTFRRTITVDDKYLFSIKDEVSNNGGAPATLYPFALISRHGTPQTAGYYILHEGLIGVLGNEGLQEFTYKAIEDKKSQTWKVANGWLGITDKYWAATLLPESTANLQARFSAASVGSLKTYQTDYLADAVTVAPGATAGNATRLFAGAKEVAVVGINSWFPGLDGYNKELDLNKFDLLIDWGWFYFITKPMFVVIDFFFKLFGNFGISILLVTVLIKGIFFPLASKSYASMAKMKAVQPQMAALRERYPDDKVKQQQELMELYKKEKINPVAGCLPIVIQIPVFFSLYKVLFITIEMRHAPFFGWIKDLSAPDPTTLFNLFGLLPYDPSQVPVIGHFLMLGVWPLIMGVTMWFQMKLNPAPPDPAQQMIFNWMPVVFTFMLSSFSAGLVIYWAWNNTLSVLQQSLIMKKHGAKIELLDNLKAVFAKRGSKPSSPS